MVIVNTSGCAVVRISASTKFYTGQDSCRTSTNTVTDGTPGIVTPAPTGQIPLLVVTTDARAVVGATGGGESSQSQGKDDK